MRGYARTVQLALSIISQFASDITLASTPEEMATAYFQAIGGRDTKSLPEPIKSRTIRQIKKLSDPKASELALGILSNFSSSIANIFTKQELWDEYREFVVIAKSLPEPINGETILALANIWFPKSISESVRHSFGKKLKSSQKNQINFFQKLARCNNISIFKIRKDRKGYTKTPLTIPQLKSRLTRNGISYKIKNKMNFGMDSEPTFADLAEDAEARWDAEDAIQAARARRRARWASRRMRLQLGPARSIEAARAMAAASAARVALGPARAVARAERAIEREDAARDAREIVRLERELAHGTGFGRRYLTNKFGMMQDDLLRTTNRSYAQVAREANETESLGAPVRVLLERVLSRIEVPAQVTNQTDLLEAYRLIRMFPQASLESTRAQRDLDDAERRSRSAWQTGRGGSRDVETTNPTAGFNARTEREMVFPRITSGRLPRWEMLRYIRNNSNPRDRSPTGKYQ